MDNKESILDTILRWYMNPPKRERFIIPLTPEERKDIANTLIIKNENTRNQNRQK